MLDLSFGSISCFATCYVSTMRVDAGLLCAIQSPGAQLYGALGGGLALVAELDCSSGDGASISGVVVLSQLGPAVVACAAVAVASGLRVAPSLAASVACSLGLAAVRFSGVPGMSVVVPCQSGWLFADLRARTRLDGSAVVCAAGVGARSVATPFGMVAGSAGAAGVTVGDLRCAVPLQAHSGASGWERPQLAAAAIAAGCGCVTGDLYVTGSSILALTM